MCMCASLLGWAGLLERQVRERVRFLTGSFLQLPVTLCWLLSEGSRPSASF